MEAELVSELPEQGRWRYEPKWDGFRGVLENDSGELALWSRNGRPLLRYFPELREVGELLPAHSALDGEIVIARDGKLDFDAMQTRLHPAESRVRKLSGEIPATFVAFDLLLWKGKPVHEQPIEKRRAQLEKVADGIALSPVSDDVEQGRDWLETLQAAGFDGVIAKKLGLPYLPGSRDGVVTAQLRNTLYFGFGNNQASTIYGSGDSYSVIAELDPSISWTAGASWTRSTSSSTTGRLIPLSSFAQDRSEERPARRFPSKASFPR